MTPHSRRIRLVSDAVVASYIHEISARRGRRAAAPSAPTAQPVTIEMPKPADMRLHFSA
jgi:hypothetical protein